MGLTDEQLSFLRKHGIIENLLFDASGLSKSEYGSLMKIRGKKVAFNVSPCKNGHSLRSRSGHCIQCDTSRIAHASITKGVGITYLAGSRKGKSFKIGFSKSKSLREESLNKENEGYGGCNDWELLLWIVSPHAADIERIAQGQLRKYQASKFYFHDGKKQEAKELFQGPYQKMKEAILFAILEKLEDPKMIKEKNHRLHRYNF